MTPTEQHISYIYFIVCSLLFVPLYLFCYHYFGDESDKGSRISISWTVSAVLTILWPLVVVFGTAWLFIYGITEFYHRYIESEDDL
jgi:hypothetical protein